MLEGDALRQGGEPVLGRLRLARRPLDQQPFLGPRRAQRVIAMRRAHAASGKARGEPRVRALPPGDLVPSLVRQAKRQRLDREWLVRLIPAQPLRGGIGIDPFWWTLTRFRERCS